MTPLRAHQNVVVKLASLGEWALRESCGDDIGDIDGGALRDKAIKLGLLAHVRVTEPCGDACHCAEYHGEFPCECLRPCRSLVQLLVQLRQKAGYPS